MRHKAFDAHWLILGGTRSDPQANPDYTPVRPTTARPMGSNKAQSIGRWANSRGSIGRERPLSKQRTGKLAVNPNQRHFGTRVNNYRCSLPGLAGFTIYRCEGTSWGHHDAALIRRRRIMTKGVHTRKPREMCIIKPSVNLGTSFNTEQLILPVND